MRKQWAAMLSMLGLVGPAMRLQSQVVKGSTPAVTNENSSAANPKVKTGKTGQKTTNNSGKLSVNQQTLRTQGQGATNGKGNPLSPSTAPQGNANNQLTPPPPGAAVTKGNNAVTKGNNAVTKGSQVTKGNNVAVTKGSSAVTKGSNAAVTKGNNVAVTKGSSAVTKGSANQQTAAGVPK